MKKNKKLFGCFFTIMLCLITALPCYAVSGKTIISPSTICEKGAIIIAENGLEHVIKVNDDGSYITELTNARSSLLSNCPHIEFRDVGSAYTVYSSVNSLKHKKGYKQPMECMRCNRVAFRYYGWVYYKHSFNKNNYCGLCGYQK